VKKSVSKFAFQMQPAALQRGVGAGGADDGTTFLTIGWGKNNWKK
jgi:hypothetical protein